MASVDRKLCVTVAKNVAKTVKMFCVKSEQLVRHNGAAFMRKQFSGVSNQGRHTKFATENGKKLRIKEVD